MAVSISGDGAVTGVGSINTNVSSTELGYLDGVTSSIQPQINTAGGLVLVHSESFSAASSIALDSVFTSDYENYRVLLRFIGTSYVGSYFYPRASGSNITTNLSRQRVTATGTSIGAASDASWVSMIAGNTTMSGYVIDFFSPNLATQTVVQAQGNQGSTNIYLSYGIHTAATPIDGFYFAPDGGTISGSVSVYGYAQ